MEKVKALAKMIDHSILHPTFTDKDLKEGCEIAKKYEVASVCVKPCSKKLRSSLSNKHFLRFYTIFAEKNALLCMNNSGE